MRSYSVVLIVLAILAAVALLAPMLLLVTAMTGIGIPLALVLGTTPALAAVLIPARLLQRRSLDPRFPRRAGRASFVGSVVFVLAVLAGLAALDRVTQTAAMRALRAEDRSALILPLAAATVAIRSADDAVTCNDLCRRLLLTGTAATVLLQKVENPTLPPDPASEAMSFRLEPRARCPEPRLGRDEGGLLEIAAERSSGTRPPSSMVLIRGRIALGTCLIDAPSRLDVADLVISRLILSRRPLGGAVGFRPGTTLIGADRLSVHQRGGGQLVETFRQTTGAAWRIWPVAVPVPTFGYGFSVGRGLGRSETVFNTDDRYYDGPARPAGRNRPEAHRGLSG